MAAVVLNNGETLLEAVPATPAVSRAVTIAEDGTAVTDHALLMDALLPEASSADRAWVLERHLSYPPAALVEPGRLSQFLELGLPTGYVVATEDLLVPPTLAHTFARRLPDVSVAEVAAGHDLMLTRPNESATALERVVR
jgi:pimeloyl-ACP methyl ester carboxylesterase